jgi:hypothetical protein
VSPETTDIVRGKNNGIAKSIAVNPVNNPFWVTRSRNGGPSPGAIWSALRNTAVAKRTGIIAMANSMAQVRRRVNITRSSESINETLKNLANNFKPLSG